MAEIVNLRMARKRKARAERERTAETNRALHGLTRAEREKAKAEDKTAARHLDAHRREKTGGPEQ